MAERSRPTSNRKPRTQVAASGETPPPNITAVGAAEDGRTPRVLALIREMKAPELRELLQRFQSEFRI